MTATSDAAYAAPNATQLPDNQRERVPALPTAVKDAKATREQLFVLRHFHLGDPNAAAQLEDPGDDLLPALLDEFRDTSRLRYEYPLFLTPSDAEGDHQEAAELARPLSRWLADSTEAIEAEQGPARILRDHLAWLERYLRVHLRRHEGPMESHPLLERAGEALQEHLANLGEDDQGRLSADLQRLVAAAPTGSQLLGYGSYAAIHLAILAIRARAVTRRSAFRNRIADSIRGLRELLSVEWAKSDHSIEPRMLRDSIGPGGDRFDPGALSGIMDHARGTREISEQRRARIEQALSVLEAWHPDPVMLQCVHTDQLGDCSLDEHMAVAAELHSDPCARAMEIFDRQAARQAEVFSALRIAQLEIKGIYDPVMHDPWFANFGWEAFSQEELLLVPTVMALESADRLAGSDLRPFSRLLSSGRPVQVLVRVHAHNNPGSRDDEDPFATYRIELGYLGIAHRQAVVAQSSGARHDHLLQGYLAALDATRTGLHIINTGLRPENNLVPLNAWLVAGAAIESRAHPFFRINPAAGDAAALRMNFDANPQPEVDWPIHRFRYQDENGNLADRELAFTFADYALLIERLRRHFRLVPAGCDSDALVPMQDYLSMSQAEAERRIPFTWAVDANARLLRLVVSRELTMACRDRLNWWHTLQELAGVRNRYVELAIERTQADERAQAAEQRARLEAEHAAELEQVRTQAASEAMQRLTDLLLGLDFGGPGLGMPRLPGASAPHPAADRTEPAPQAAETDAPPSTDEDEDEEELNFDEPWIDTPLCTSCNDCLKINPLMFVYNEEKQAILEDVSKATFAQLVEAAELCPAKCIHPGKPWNPDEPNLEQLVARAEPFNH